MFRYFGASVSVHLISSSGRCFHEKCELATFHIGAAARNVAEIATIDTDAFQPDGHWVTADEMKTTDFSCWALRYEMALDDLDQPD